MEEEEKKKRRRRRRRREGATKNARPPIGKRHNRHTKRLAALRVSTLSG
jgi:hypothetical protein